jgi:hypothetical protein
MRDSSIWGFAGIAVAILLVILASRVTQHEAWFWGAAGLCGWIALVIFAWPFLRYPGPIIAMASGLLLLIGGGIWLYTSEFRTYPGLFVVSLIRLYDSPDLRRKYVFDFNSPDGATASFYLASDDLFRFTLKDINGESYSLEAPIGNEGIPVDRPIFLYFDVGVSDTKTFLRIFVNGGQVSERAYDFPIKLGSMKWQHVTLGADTAGQNNAAFKVEMFGFGHETLSDSQISKFKSRIDTYMRAVGAPTSKPAS